MEIKKLFKYGLYSYCITIPKKFLNELGFTKDDIFLIEIKDETIIIKKYYPDNIFLLL